MIISRIILDFERGGPMTKQQTLICDILANVHDHLTAEEVFFRAREKMPNIAMGTVYRNLNQLAADRQIRRLTVPGQPDRYDKNPMPHGHLVCQTCGKLQDLFLPDLVPYLEQAAGENITHYELTMGHICPNCK